jgi:ABC-type transport system involved in cytochrome bd biosynthesis fused ATPase/permease subunit
VFAVILLSLYWRVAVLPLVLGVCFFFLLQKAAQNKKSELYAKKLSAQLQRLKASNEMVENFENLQFAGMLNEFAAETQRDRDAEVSCARKEGTFGMWFGTFANLVTTVGAWGSTFVVLVTTNYDLSTYFLGSMMLPLVYPWAISPFIYGYTELNSNLDRVNEVLSTIDHSLELSLNTSSTDFAVQLDSAAWKIYDLNQSILCDACGSVIADDAVEMNGSVVHATCLALYKREAETCSFCRCLLFHHEMIMMNGLQFHAKCLLEKRKNLLVSCEACEKDNVLRICKKCNRNFCDACLLLLDQKFFCRECLVSDIFVVGPLSYNFLKRSKVSIFGKKGCGKTSLMMGLLGNLTRLTGTSLLNGSCAVLTHSVFVLPDTSFRDNIVFGKEFDAEKYAEVLRVCALQQDIERFDNKDELLLKANGANISGGQLKRMGLARVLYTDADIIFLDDPFVGLDHKTEVFVFNNAVEEYLSNKTVFFCSEKAVKPFNIKIEVSQKGCCSLTQELNDQEFKNLELTENTDHGEKAGEKMDVTSIDQHKVEISEPTPSWIEFFQHVPLLFYLVLFLTVLGNGLSILDTFLMSFWLTQAYGVRGTYWALMVLANRIVSAILQAVISYLLMHVQLDQASKIIDKIKLGFQTSSSESVHKKSSMIKTVLSGDISRIDSDRAIPGFLGGSLGLVSDVVSIGLAFPYALASLCVFPLLYFFIAKPIINMRNNLNAIEQSKRSQLQRLVSAYLSGTFLVRVFGAKKHFEARLQKIAANFVASKSLLSFSGRALSFPLEVLTGFVICCVMVAVTFLKGSIADATYLSLALIRFVSIPAQSVWLFNEYAAATDFLVTFSRAKNSCSHFEAEKSSENTPSSSWPGNGLVCFRNFSANFPGVNVPCLTNLSVEITPGQLTAVIGRTGSGKSSLLKSILKPGMRTHGSIEIDEVDVTDFPPQILRDKITFVPQVPALLSGSLRRNLDPESILSDDEIWSKISEFGLSGFDNLNENLHSGQKMSSKEKILIGLIRGCLKRNRVILIDEAIETTEAMMGLQKLRLTVVAVTHHFNLLNLFDNIILISDGNVIEQGKASMLLQNRESKTSVFIQNFDEH